MFGVNSSRIFSGRLLMKNLLPELPCGINLVASRHAESILISQSCERNKAAPALIKTTAGFSLEFPSLECF